MTFSLLARDVKTDTLAAAAATGNLAVGGWVLHAEAGTGLVASQGYSVSSVWSRRAMNDLRQGSVPEDIVSSLTDSDEGSGFRQLAVMNVHGDSAGWTGANNEDSKGHRSEQDLVVAGNWLTSLGVLDAMRASWRQSQGPIVERLLQALKAAANEGGDSRGLLSAAVKVYATDKPPVDLRVDYSESPLADLTALYERTQHSDYAGFMVRLPTDEDPYRC